MSATEHEEKGVRTPGVDPADFKHAFRFHPAGVAVITAASADGPVGLTASSVASVAVDPAALVFSLTSGRGSAAGVLAAESFVVHLLNAAQRQVAESFAIPGAERFTKEQGWTFRPDGLPVLPGVHAALRCSHLQRFPVGSSTVVVAAIEEIIVNEPGDPLVYVDRTFHALSESTVLS